jgi:hypothetical protein
MKNVFGKQPTDYGIIRRQCDGMSRQQIIDSLNASGCKAKWDYTGARQNFQTDAEANVAAFGLISNNLEAMQMEIEEILRERFKIPEFVPINSAIPEGATSYALRVINRFGKGKFINKDGSNVETSTASIAKVVFNVEYAGIEAKWTLQELRECLFTGISLNSECLEAAMQGALDHMQEVGFNGDSDVGFTGLLNSEDVPVYEGTVPDFTDAGTDETDATDFVNGLITTMGETSNEIIYEHFGNTELVMVVPTKVFDFLTTKKCGADASRNIAQYLSQNNPWTQRTGKELKFKSLPRAKDAAVTGTGRVIVYPMNKRVLEMAIPIMPRIITTINEGYTIKAPMEYSMSGVNIKRASLMLYADGVLGAPAEG